MRQVTPAFASRLLRVVVGEEMSLSWFSLREEPERSGDCYFLLPDCLANASCFFFSAALSAFDFCCVDFFWLAFGDLSPIILLLFFALTDLRHNWFRLRQILVIPVAAIVKQLRPIRAFLLRRLHEGDALTPGKGEHRASSFGHLGAFCLSGQGAGKGETFWAMGVG
jgi:hypothetical protein